jgi:hypothetical protein
MADDFTYCLPVSHREDSFIDASSSLATLVSLSFIGNHFLAKLPPSHRPRIKTIPIPNPKRGKAVDSGVWIPIIAAAKDQLNASKIPIPILIENLMNPITSSSPLSLKKIKRPDFSKKNKGKHLQHTTTKDHVNREVSYKQDCPES